MIINAIRFYWSSSRNEIDIWYLAKIVAFFGVNNILELAPFREIYFSQLGNTETFGISPAIEIDRLDVVFQQVKFTEVQVQVRDDSNTWNTLGNLTYGMANTRNSFLVSANQSLGNIVRDITLQGVMGLGLGDIFQANLVLTNKGATVWSHNPGDLYLNTNPVSTVSKISFAGINLVADSLQITWGNVSDPSVIYVLVNGHRVGIALTSGVATYDISTHILRNPLYLKRPNIAIVKIA